MSDQRSSDSEQSKISLPSFLEARPPLIQNPFMRPRPQKGTRLLDLFEEESELEEPEWLQVYLRLKPCQRRNNLYEVKSDRCLITSVDTAPMGHGRRTQHNVSKMYTFTHIFGTESQQKDVFEKVVKGSLRKLPEGHNFTLLTYGASGSGKTYTLMGTIQAPGLVPRSLEYVFRIVDAAQQPLYKPVDGGAERLEYYSQEFEMQFVKRLRQVSGPLRDKYRRMSVQLRNELATSNYDLSNRTRYFVWVSFVEIYNEAIYDLLTNSDRSKATSKLRIREDPNGQVYVKGATQAFVRSGEEAYDVMVAGKHNLQVAATGVHANSSRSHCIFTITMLTETDEGVRTSCVRLCDLAGCERARHTRNTGARMQESRAINSSLHVLERCLHMLRRKQKKVDATLVPYRESKLTRLLGAGLSGARGEAVSMVVTLNPAPEFAHETKHVLQLAAVAKDIQVNHTIPESSLESSSSLPDTTVESSAELMRLRADNERLHFELAQSESRNTKLLAAMEEKQQQAANKMFEFVEEAKDMTKQFYEAQMQALKKEMEEMEEEYEARLKTAAAHARIMRDSHTEMGTPSRSLQRKIAELMTEIAILQEKITAEQLARARAEEEVQHLRACIDERDEKHDNDSGLDNDEVVSVTDSEDEKSESDHDESDPLNESLEPTFTKEDINRTRMLQQSLINDSKLDTTNNITEILPSDNEDNDTIKNCTQDDTMKDNKTCVSDESNDTQRTDGTFDQSNYSADNLTKTPDHIQGETNTVKKKNASSFRGTYVVRNDVQINDELLVTSKELDISNSIKNIRKSVQDMKNSFNNDIEKSIEETVNKMSDRITDVIMEKLIEGEPKCSHYGDDGYLEKEAGIDNPPQTENNILKEEVSDLSEKNHNKVTMNTHYRDGSLDEFECLEKAAKIGSSLQTVQENKPANDFAAINSETEKLGINSFKSSQHNDASIAQFEQLEIASGIDKPLQAVQKKTKTLPNPRVLNLDRNNKVGRSDSLAFFENLEKVMKSEIPRPTIQKSTEAFSSLKVIKEKRKYFDGNNAQHDVVNKDRPYFDNIDVNIETNKNIAEVSKHLDDERSPSIVKEEVTNNFEPSTIKKLLGESFSRQPELLSVPLPKKHNSVDIFEGFDSPYGVKTVENPESAKKQVSIENDSATKLVPGASPNKVDTKYTEKTDVEKSDVLIKPEIKNDTHNILKEIAKTQIEQSETVSKCVEKFSIESKVDNNEETRMSVENPVLDDEIKNEIKDKCIQIKQERVSVEPPKEEIVLSKNPTIDNCTDIAFDNTLEGFDKIYKEISCPRSTEFEVLVTTVNQSDVTVSNVTDNKDIEKPKYNLRHAKLNTFEETREVNSVKRDKSTDKKTGAIKKDFSSYKTNIFDNKEDADEIILETKAKCESQRKPKRNLRLRRRKNDSGDDKDQEVDVKSDAKLKDIVNLQTEFSDVILGVPAPVHVPKDIESPERKESDENIPPLLGAQSCPSKSVTRSRRKLFTPRAEPLEESMGASGESNEKIRIPRPSYHRPRARRKL